MTSALLQKIHIKTLYLVEFFTAKGKAAQSSFFPPSLPPQEQNFLIEQENCIKTY